MDGAQITRTQRITGCVSLAMPRQPRILYFLRQTDRLAADFVRLSRQAIGQNRREIGLYSVALTAPTQGLNQHRPDDVMVGGERDAQQQEADRRRTARRAPPARGGDRKAGHPDQEGVGGQGKGVPVGQIREAWRENGTDQGDQGLGLAVSQRQSQQSKGYGRDQNSSDAQWDQMIEAVGGADRAVQRDSASASASAS